MAFLKFQLNDFNKNGVYVWRCFRLIRDNEFEK